VPLFTYAFRNVPESVIEGRITTSGGIEYYFVAFSSISFLVIEVKLRILVDRWNAIAQVIAECDGQFFKILGFAYRKTTSVGPTQNFLPMDAPDSNCRSSRFAIKTELPNQLVFDEVRVFQRLGLSQVPDALISACATSFPSANTASINELQRITAAAEGKDLDEWEAEIIVTNDDGERIKVRKKQVGMYPHLVCFHHRY
jgi:hypothetical protein